ncbi:MAG: HEAT repeat domain-containing protein [Cyanobacteriota bacterium]|nr:HEAT repeat domain-containing protein [Cyanobacteriota bacterium]
MTPASLSALINRLEVGSFQDRWEVAKLLPSHGEAVLPRFLELLQEEESDGELRWFVTRMLAEMPGQATVSALLGLVNRTTDGDLARAATVALGHCGAPGIEALVSLLPSPEHRLIVTQALAHSGHPASLPPLLDLARHQDPALRALALEGLGLLADPLAVSPLLAALADGVAAVRRQAALGLATVMPLIEPQRCLEGLRPLLADPHLPVAQAAAQTLGCLASPLAIAALAPLLTTPLTPEPLQKTALQALGWRPSQAVLELWRDLWPQATPARRLDLITALEGWTEAAWAEPVGDTLQAWLIGLGQPDPDPSLPQKRAIVLALGRLQVSQAVPLLRPLCHHPDPALALHAAAALRLLGQEMA